MNSSRSGVRLGVTVFYSLFLLSCTELTWHEHPPPATLGEAAYDVVHVNLEEAAQCRDERLEPLVANRDSFIHAIDSIFPPPFNHHHFRQFVEETVFPLVDDQQLPGVSDLIASQLQRLIDDERDPERLTLNALLRLAQTRTIVEPRHLVTLLERLVDDPQLIPLVQSFSALAQERNGADYTVNEFFRLSSAHLLEFSEPSQCTPLDSGNLEHTLLRDDLFNGEPLAGVPAWFVRSDVHGNPRVATDATQRLHPPFVDADFDGAADVNAKGAPIDARGEVITLKTLGRTGNRDHHGRATTPSGELLYDYFDARKTGLAMGLNLVGEFLKERLHHDALSIVNAALTPSRTCHGGAASCLAFSSENHPIADLSHLLIELARFEQVKELLRTWAQLLEDNPALAEEILVALGQVLENIEGSDLSLSHVVLLDLITELLPLLEDIFHTPNSSRASTGRLLMETIEELRETSAQFPQELVAAIDYRNLHKEEACSDEKPNLERSTPVDYSKARSYRSPAQGVIDNRSSLEQSVELFTSVDCGSVPFTGGQTVAEFLLESTAGMSSDDVCTLTDSFLGLIGVFPWMGETLTTTTLNLIGCDGEVVWNNLQALDTLAKSGALNTYIPIATVFAEHDQIETLIQLLQLAADDLRRDDDQRADTTSVIRALLPLISEALHARVFDPLFDFNDLLVNVSAVNGSGTAADVMIDSLEHFLDSTGVIHTRSGPRVNTSLAQELLPPMRRLALRIEEAQALPSLRNITHHLTSYLRETRVDTLGTPQLGDDQTRLANRRVLPLAQMLLGLFVELLDLPNDERHCHLDTFQSTSNRYLTGRNFADLIHFMDTLKNSTHAAPLEQSVVRFLSQEPPQGYPDVFSPLVQILTGAIQTSINAEDTQVALAFAAAAINPEAPRGAPILATLDKLLTTDSRNFLLSLIQNALDQGPMGLESAPLTDLGALFMEIATVSPRNQCMPRGDAWTAADVEPVLRSVIDFIATNEYGLNSIWTLVQNRTHPSSPDQN